MTTDQKPPIAIVNEYVPPRPPPTKEEMRAERLRQLSLQMPKPVAWSVMEPKQKFLVTGGFWLLSVFCAYAFIWDGQTSGKGLFLVPVAFLGWPVPLFYLIKSVWQEMPKK